MLAAIRRGSVIVRLGHPGPTAVPLAPLCMVHPVTRRPASFNACAGCVLASAGSTMSILRVLAALALVTSSVSAVLGGCGSAFSAGDGGAPSGTGGGAGTGGGGTGASSGCGGPEHCPGQDLQCIKRTCEAGVCGVSNVTIGEPTEQQSVGDCVISLCDGQGSPRVENDDSDVFDDGDPCTADACQAGTPTNDIAPGVPCTTAKNTAGLCTQAGECVQCVVATDCVGDESCEQGQCVPPTCVNGSADPGETDQDCGGSVCPPCDAGQTCNVAADCISGVCKGKQCQPPTCTDTVSNGKETGVDCGGADCPNCPTGEECKKHVDCQSHVCVAGICQAPSCVDGKKNGDETDQDCGGSCPPCPMGDDCALDADCQSQYCASGVCSDPCSNGVLDVGETDVDCGGLVCDPCGVGQTCVCESDCASGVCCLLVIGDSLDPVCAANVGQCQGTDPTCG